MYLVQLFNYTRFSIKKKEIWFWMWDFYILNSTNWHQWLIDDLWVGKFGNTSGRICVYPKVSYMGAAVISRSKLKELEFILSCIFTTFMCLGYLWGNRHSPHKMFQSGYYFHLKETKHIVWWDNVLVFLK